jgi:hypothetical protein
MNNFNNFNRSSKSYPLRNNLNNKIMDSMSKPTTSNKDLLEQLKAEKIEFDIPSNDEGGDDGVGDRMGESEEEKDIINSNKIIKGISPGAVFAVSEGPRPCKTKADNTDLVQANLSASIVEEENINSNKRMKGISPGAVLAVSEGPRPCKTKADNTDLVQANLSASIVGSSKDHPSKPESVLLTSHFERCF